MYNIVLEIREKGSRKSPLLTRNYEFCKNIKVLQRSPITKLRTNKSIKKSLGHRIPNIKTVDKCIPKRSLRLTKQNTLTRRRRRVNATETYRELN